MQASNLLAASYSRNAFISRFQGNLLCEYLSASSGIERIREEKSLHVSLYLTYHWLSKVQREDAVQITAHTRSLVTAHVI